MTRVAVTGHRLLPPATARLVDTALRHEIALYPPATLEGLSCLADGADALFAQAILHAGARLTAIVPCLGYREALPADHHDLYDILLGGAHHVIRLDHPESTADAHMDASATMLAHADHLVAVWDGQPARGYGGTADVVELARERGIPVTVVWPSGATRD
ncbi:hypothetical protein [Saccharothrix sp.]|uniref:hypothetical protein n=1 Tax=Saccharothrix sp. TaxID=1873460 RepID=UPI0028117409|nr:hypothetical protein [Saccharothrix sp.]